MGYILLLQLNWNFNAFNGVCVSKLELEPLHLFVYNLKTHQLLYCIYFIYYPEIYPAAI